MTSALLVTGAGGLLGARLVERLAEDSAVEIVATFRTQTDRLMPRPPAQVHYVRCDLASRSDVADLFSQRHFGAVVHTAASLPARGPDNPAPALRDNVVALANLVSAAHAGGVSRFVFCSSIGVYEPFTSFDEDTPLNPFGAYARSKYVGEQILQLAAGGDGSMAGISLRLAGLHGPGRTGGVVHHMISAACQHMPLSVAEPDSRFRLCFTDDAVDAIMRALRAALPMHHACYNIAGRDSYTLSALAERIRFLTGSSGEIREVRPSPARDMAMPISRAARELGYQPRGLDSHLIEMIEAVRGELRT